MPQVTRDLVPNELDPKSVLNEILFFQNKVKENQERISDPLCNLKIKRCLKWEISRYKKFIAGDKKTLRELIK